MCFEARPTGRASPAPADQFSSTRRMISGLSDAMGLTKRPPRHDPSDFLGFLPASRKSWLHRVVEVGSNAFPVAELGNALLRLVALRARSGSFLLEKTSFGFADGSLALRLRWIAFLKTRHLDTLPGDHGARNVSPSLEGLRVRILLTGNGKISSAGSSSTIFIQPSPKHTKTSRSSYSLHPNTLRHHDLHTAFTQTH
jgi:hypothetical protein